MSGSSSTSWSVLSTAKNLLSCGYPQCRWNSETVSFKTVPETGTGNDWSVYSDAETVFKMTRTEKISLQTKFRYEYEKKEAKLRSEQEKERRHRSRWTQKKKQVRNGWALAGFAIVPILWSDRVDATQPDSKGKNEAMNFCTIFFRKKLRKNSKWTGTRMRDSLIRSLSCSLISKVLHKFLKIESRRTCKRYWYSLPRFLMPSLTNTKSKKIKTIGDSYTAGGLPGVDNSHASLVVSAALEIGTTWIASTMKEKKLNQDLFEIRIGIHSGPEVCRNCWCEKIWLRHLGWYCKHRIPHGKQRWNRTN